MSETQLSDRPAFQSLDISNERDQPPVSRLAVAALIAGLVSLFAPLSFVLLPLALLAAAFGAAVVWKVSREEYATGTWLAHLGLGLAVAATVWTITATGGKERYLYDQAGEHAEHFLQLLSEGRPYEALELRMPEGDRQITGTNLEEYYASITGEERDDIEGFLYDDLTEAIQKAGPDADWELSHGIDVKGSGDVVYVTVEMVNAAETRTRQSVKVILRRTLGLMVDEDKRDSTALWNVVELIL